MEAENAAVQPVMVRRIKPVVMPRDNQKASEKARMWKRAGAVAVLGVLFGFATSLWFEAANLPISKVQRVISVENNHSRQTSVLVVPVEPATVKQAADNSAEVEKLKTRNRRLEALVEVLQQRARAEKRDTGLKIKN